MQQEVGNDVRISVIIPALNDAALIRETVESALLMGDVQVLVVDSGSTDGTAAIARRAGAKTCRAIGRGGRLTRACVREATGDVVVFAAPGTCLPKDAASAVREAVSNPQVLGGRFRCQVAGKGFGHWLLRSGHALLSLAGLPPFDAPWFVWRTAADGERGLRGLPVFAERDLLRRVHKRGKLVKLNSVATLGHGHGIHRLFWTAMQLAYDLGISPRLLAKFYWKPRCSDGERPMAAVEALNDSISRPAGTAM